MGKMITKAVPVILNVMNLYGGEEYQEGLNIAVQGGSVYTAVKDHVGNVQVTMLNMTAEDLN